MAQNKWTENELTLALSFYYEIPFGKINHNNSFIIEKANIIHRTPSALAMKLCNLAALDESLLRRGVTSLSHTSKLDKEIWNKYKDNYSLLLENRDRILATYQYKDSITEPDHETDNNMEDDDLPSDFAFEEKTIIVRKKQAFFRNAVLSAYNFQCCMTGIAIPELLQACHIKPWSKCEQTNARLNPSNGLCLNYLCHKAFDIGFISVHKKKKIILVSESLKTHNDLDETTKNWLLSLENQSINLPQRNSPGEIFLEYHNDCIFQK